MLNDILSWFDLPSMAQLANFHFMRPWWLLSLIPLLWVYRRLAAKDDLTAQWQGHMSAKVIKQLTVNEQQHLFFTPKRVFAVFAILTTLIMAGPTWNKAASPFFVDQSALIIALDVSESMQSSDIQPSRLLRGKQKIVELLKLRGDAKTALVVYAGSAHIAMPITEDKKMILHFLDVLDTDLLPVPDSQPQSVVAPTQTLLDQADAASTVLLITDKTNQQAIAAFQEILRDQPHYLLVWAMGENPDSGLASATGISTQNLALLDRLASENNGDLVLFTHNADDINQVDQAIENNMQAADDDAQPWYDQGYMLLFLLLPLQALWFRKGWTMQW